MSPSAVKNNYCLICCSVIKNAEEVVEDKSDCIFLLKILLEISEYQIESLLHKGELEDDLDFNQSIKFDLNWVTVCEQCGQSFRIAKQLYKEILEVTKRFREIQQELVEKVLKEDKKIISDNWTGPLFTQCRKLITNYDYGEFGYPFIVRDLNVDFTNFKSTIKTEPPEDNEDTNDDLTLLASNSFENRTTRKVQLICDKDFAEVSVKEEVLSANGSEEDDDPHRKREEVNNDHNLEEDSENDTQETSEESEKESDPPSPPPPPPLPSLPHPPSIKPRNKRKRKPVVKKPRKPKTAPLSRFARLHPEITFLRDPTTLKFHCLDPNCVIATTTKTNIEVHYQNIHLKEHKYICDWPDCYSLDYESLDKDGNPIQKKKSFALEKHYQVHMDRHKGTPRLKCDICNEPFYTAINVAQHKQLVHEGEGEEVDESCEKIVNVVCELCGKVLKYKANLARHMSRVHLKKPWKYQCHLCPCSFESPSQLQRHLDVSHTDGKRGGGRPKGSGKIYNWPLKLKELRNEETQCPVKGCRQLSTTPEGLKKHIENWHGGKVGVEEVELRYKCKWCGKGFHQKFKWQLHLEQHENKESRPYKCELCQKGFPTVHYLKYHKKHTHKIVKK